jgi:2-oxoglutarate dehydrogenase complex dehydrogenase (E1) component-like enzyme
MNRKIAAVLLAATMLTTPAFAASVASSSSTPTAPTETSAKVTKPSEKDVKKHRVHARAAYGHKVHHATYAKPSQMKHSHRVSKKSLTSAGKESDTKTIAVAPVKAPVKN